MLDGERNDERAQVIDASRCVAVSDEVIAGPIDLDTVKLGPRCDREELLAQASEDGRERQALDLDVWREELKARANGRVAASLGALPEHGGLGERAETRQRCVAM